MIFRPSTNIPLGQPKLLEHCMIGSGLQFIFGVANRRSLASQDEQTV
jgi:hypothetical protein